MFNDELKNEYYLSVDVGGTYVKFGVLKKENDIFKIIHFKRIKTNSPINPKNFVKIVSNEIKKILLIFENKNFIFKKKIGISFPITNNENDLITTFNLGKEWIKIPLKSMLEKELVGFQIFLGNDADFATLCEFKQGVLKNCDNGVLITIGTGIGGGLIINNKLFDDSGIAPELGHIIVGESGLGNNCQHLNCLEAYSSEPSLIKYVKKLIENEESSLKKFSNFDAEIIFNEAKKGDEVSLKGVERMLEYLSRGIASFVMIFNPKTVAIGGGVCKAGDYLIKKLEEKVKPKLMKGFNNPKIMIAKEKNDSGMIGAAYYTMK